jgi:hypothetical protein
MNKTAAIESALRCFACGLLALVPMLGLPFVVAALVFFSKSSASSQESFNPARRYAFLGITFATIGLLVSTTATWWTVVFWFTRDL